MTPTMGAMRHALAAGTSAPEAGQQARNDRLKRPQSRMTAFIVAVPLLLLETTVNRTHRRIMPQRDITGLQSAEGHTQPSRTPDDAWPEIWIFQCPRLLHLQQIQLYLPVAVHSRCERAPWRAPPKGTTTVYELLHRYGSQHPRQ